MKRSGLQDLHSLRVWRFEASGPRCSKEEKGRGCSREKKNSLDGFAKIFLGRAGRDPTLEKGKEERGKGGRTFRRGEKKEHRAGEKVNRERKREHARSKEHSQTLYGKRCTLLLHK